MLKHIARDFTVNRLTGDPASQLHERHGAGDFDMKTQYKLKAGS